jgi:hypothetical protein
MRIFVLLPLLGLLACTNATERPYRLPYASGVEVTITNDHTDHSTPVAEMFDMRATDSGQTIVAAAPGWIREIEDTKDSSSATNNYVWIEHPLDYCQPPGGITTGPPTGECRTCAAGVGKCNEWTLYAHMLQNSVASRDHNVGDWVEEGEAIATEGDVGFTPCGGSTSPQCGRHLHFVVFTIDRDATSAQGAPTVNGDYEFYAINQAEFGDGRPERVPLFCTADGLRLVRTGQSYLPGACPPLN